MPDPPRPAPGLPDALTPFAAALASGPTRDGELTWFRHDDPIGRSLELYGEWAGAEIELLRCLVGPGDTVVDVGSYIGTHVRALAAAVGPTGRVVAFEPQPVVIDVLRHNAASAAAPVQVVHAAVGEAAGAVEVPAPDVGRHGNFGASVLGSGDPGAREVELVALDDLPLTGVRLIKIDVEGMEASVLAGATRTLEAARPVVYAEINTLSAGAPAMALLQGWGFEMWLHRPAAYNPDNFAGEHENVFGFARESNLLAVPAERAAQVAGLLRSREDVVAVRDLDDLARELGRTPRYGDESPEDRDAAVLAPRLHALEREHAQRTAEWEARLRELHEQLAAASEQRDDLARTLAERVAQVGALTAELLASRAGAQRAQARVAAMEASTAWRLTAPVRRAGDLKRALRAHAAGRLLRLLVLTATGRLPRELRRRKHRDLLVGSGLFDPVHYVVENPDVAPGSAVDHYLEHGGVEGRRPNAVFDGDWYLSTYPDVAASGLNPLLHYVLSGAAEGRDPGPGFSTTYYLAANDDVRGSGVNPLAHYLADGQAEGRAPKPVSELDEEEPAPRPVAPTAQEWSAVAPPAADRPPSVVVIVPVYRGYDETLRCLYSVLSSSVRTSYRLVVVDDASPEPELSEALRALAGRGLFELLVNEHNSGFVRSVNRGMREAPGLDVVLLNSDTEVYGDWLDRLAEAARSSPRCASVTPLTNSGTIASYPRFVRDNPGALEVDPAVLDRLAAEHLAGARVEIPTCVGFCVYLRADCLREVGLFDEASFGLGYGEENDWSLRATAKGWTHVLAGGVYVRHYGSTSFGSSAAARQRNGLQVLNERYPGYDRLIAAHIAADPAHQLRRVLDLARLRELAGGRPALLLVSHALGGGTTRHVHDLAAQLDAEGVFALVLRPAPDGARVRLTGHGAAATPNLDFAWSGGPDQALVVVLRSLQVVHVHVHHLQGYQDGPAGVLALAAALDVELDLTLHDYMTVCPRIDMVDDSRRYCGGSQPAKCRACISRNGSPFGKPDAAAWQAEHAALLRAARRVLVPSDDAAQRFRQWLPDVEVEVLPHPEERPAPAPELPAASDGLRHVGVLGAIGISKGSEVLRALAADAQRRELPLRFHVFGHTNDDASFRGLTNVSMSGRYAPQDLPALVAGAGCRIALFPAVWPETFSYTLSEAWDLGLHPVCFDIGAVAGRIRADGAGTILPWELVDDPAAVNDRLLELEPSIRPAPRAPASYETLMTDYYRLGEGAIRRRGD